MTTTIKVKGMSCPHCVGTVTKTLNQIPGVRDVTVCLASGEVSFQQEGTVDMNLVTHGIEQAGYELG